MKRAGSQFFVFEMNSASQMAAGCSPPSTPEGSIICSSDFKQESGSISETMVVLIGDKIIPTWFAQSHPQNGKNLLPSALVINLFGSLNTPVPSISWGFGPEGASGTVVSPVSGAHQRVVLGDVHGEVKFSDENTAIFSGSGFVSSRALDNLGLSKSWTYEVWVKLEKNLFKNDNKRSACPMSLFQSATHSDSVETYDALGYGIRDWRSWQHFGSNNTRVDPGRSFNTLECEA